MTKIAAAVALVAALAAAASAESYTLKPTDGAGSGYTVSADHAPVMTPQGVPAFPPGTRLSVDAKGASSFEVFVIGPSALDEGSAHHHWATTLTEKGGYKLQFGRERQAYLSQLDVIVSEDPARLAQTTPYDYGWDDDE